jgi:hypothetical protein
MRIVAWGSLLSALLFFVLSCQPQPVPEKPPAGDEPPLLLEDEPPLLLEEPIGDEQRPPPEGPVADNSRCHVCHVNYQEEELAVTHARGNVGCEDCHGSCDAHCSDEDNITPPDIMYPAAKINPFCMTCHAEVKDDPELAANHEEVLKGTAAENKLCTDCHGKHRLGYRTRRWNKETGELLDDDSVRMITDDMLEQK